MGTAQRAGITMPIEGMLPRTVALPDDPEEARIIAVSRVLAAEATAYGGQPQEDIIGVQDFRAAYLPDGLVPDVRVEQWIPEQGMRDQTVIDADGQPRNVSQSFWLAGLPINLEEDVIAWHDDRTVTVQVRVPMFGATQVTAAFTANEHPSLSERYVRYSTPTRSHHQRAVRAGGVLDHLRRLALDLSETYLWTEEQATVFVLTGLIPHAGAFATQATQGMKRKPRGMSHKHMELAIFNAEHGGEPYAVRMEVWNTLHPEWAYTQAPHFGGDSRLALKRLTGDLPPSK